MNAGKPSMTTVPARERGAVLVMAMLILIIMTLLGITSMSTGMLEERQARNMRDMNLALQGAEIALEDAEKILEQAVIPVFDGATVGYYPEEPNDFEYFDDPNWDWITDAIEYTGTFAGVAGNDPRFYIEEIEVVVEQGKSLVIGFTPNVGTTSYYKVTALGMGGGTTGSPSTTTILQTTYKR